MASVVLNQIQINLLNAVVKFYTIHTHQPLAIPQKQSLNFSSQKIADLVE
jgi:hypothetical protein